MNDHNSTQEAIRFLVNKWRHREDFKIPFTNRVLIPNNKIRAVVQDVIDIIYKDIKPIIIKQSRSTFILSIPPGITFKGFVDKKDFFQDALGYDVHIEKNGMSIKMKVMTEPLETFYPYQFNPGDYPDMLLPFPVGYTAKGLLVRDMAKIIYLLIGGIPDGGKSNCIHTIAASLLQTNRTMVVMFDFKESEYPYMDEYGKLITDEAEALRALTILNMELDRRKKWLRQIGEVKVHNVPESKRPPFITLIIDELTELQNKQSQELLNRIMRLGRALGFICILATQKCSAKAFRNGTFTETRSLCAGRICFRVMSKDDSIMVLNNGSAVDLPHVNGRAIFQFDTEIQVQTMFLDPKKVVNFLPSNKERVIIFESENEQSPKMLPPRQQNS